MRVCRFVVSLAMAVAAPGQTRVKLRPPSTDFDSFAHCPLGVDDVRI